MVLQAGHLLALFTVIVAPTSTAAQPASFPPEITVGGARTRVLVDQLTAVHAPRLGRSVGVVTWRELGEVDASLAVALGLAR